MEWLTSSASGFSFAGATGMDAPSAEADLDRIHVNLVTCRVCDMRGKLYSDEGVPARDMLSDRLAFLFALGW